MSIALPARIDLQSRLPQVGTTIFTVMSALATETGAINLGQGFPDFDCDPVLVDAVVAAMRAGHNQYPPMAGVMTLREAIARKIERCQQRRYDPVNEITVTAGATQAILTTVLCVVHPGDEVVLLEPAYDSYVPAIELAGGIPVRVQMDPATLRPDFDRIREAVTPRTRALIYNTPNNPTGMVWSAAERQQLADLLRDTPVIVISDEVYEHMVYDGAAHASASAHDELAARSFVISSFGKTFHVTGWKVGYVAAPAALTAEFRKVHQFNVFTVNTPMQHGLAAHLADAAHVDGLAPLYQAKRDLFREGLARTPLRLLPCEGTYFQCVEYEAVSGLPDHEFCSWLTREVGVAAIPLSAFYAQPPATQRVRFCFAKRDETLNAALERMARLPQR